MLLCHPFDVELFRLKHFQVLRKMLFDPDRRRRTQSEIGHVAEYKKHIPRLAGANRRLAFIAYVPAIAGIAQGVPLQRQRDQNDDHKKYDHSCAAAFDQFSVGTGTTFSVSRNSSSASSLPTAVR